MRLFGKILKYVFYTFVFSVCGLVIFRSCIMFDYYPKQMKNILWTEASLEAYNSDPENFKAYSQDLSFSYDNADEGNFWGSHQLILPSINQIQITVRYNDSTLERYAEKYEKNIEDIKFVFYLSDNNGNHYPLSTSCNDRAFNLYNYERLVFDEVDITKLTNLYLDIYFEGNVDLDAEPIACIALYEAEKPLEKVRISAP